ncbi:MAG: CtsR family transcriptional regulator [Clostridiales bacterium]|nr:CtsR family transcriptional regulator [Clostridiales bacterium]
MNLSNSIAQMILDMLKQNDSAEIQRNELAQTLGCVPSQINYVISSRFTPEQGYIVESRRGGGGYIRISRVKIDRNSMFMHVVNSVGSSIDEKTCRAHILNMANDRLFDVQTARLLLAATSDICLKPVPPDIKNNVRASIFKQMLITLI